jgi:hypothetical protein
MPKDVVPEADIYNFIRADGAAMRVRRYRQEAHRFRGLAQIETNEEFREALLSIAKEYEALVASLVPTAEDDP